MKTTKLKKGEELYKLKLYHKSNKFENDEENKLGQMYVKSLCLVHDERVLVFVDLTVQVSTPRILLGRKIGAQSFHDGKHREIVVEKQYFFSPKPSELLLRGHHRTATG